VICQPAKKANPLLLFNTDECCHPGIAKCGHAVWLLHVSCGGNKKLCIERTVIRVGHRLWVCLLPSSFVGL
jgi:hypothetical protein